MTRKSGVGRGVAIGLPIASVAVGFLRGPVLLAALGVVLGLLILAVLLTRPNGHNK